MGSRVFVSRPLTATHEEFEFQQQTKLDDTKTYASDARQVGSLFGGTFGEAAQAIGIPSDAECIWILIGDSSKRTGRSTRSGMSNTDCESILEPWRQEIEVTVRVLRPP